MRKKRFWNRKSSDGESQSGPPGEWVGKINRRVFCDWTIVPLKQVTVVVLLQVDRSNQAHSRVVGVERKEVETFAEARVRRRLREMSGFIHERMLEGRGVGV